MIKTVLALGAGALVTVYAAGAVLCAVFLIWATGAAWAIHCA